MVTVAEKNRQSACGECSQCVIEASQAPKHKNIYIKIVLIVLVLMDTKIVILKICMYLDSTNSKLQAPLLTQEQLLL